MSEMLKKANEYMFEKMKETNGFYRPSYHFSA